MSNKTKNKTIKRGALSENAVHYIMIIAAKVVHCPLCQTVGKKMCVYVNNFQL